MRRPALMALACAAAFGLAACGESDQVVVYKQGKYQGKPDTRPWDNAPLAYGTNKWTKGDKTSWEKHLQTRSLGQNDYNRIERQ